MCSYAYDDERFGCPLLCSCHPHCHVRTQPVDEPHYAHPTPQSAAPQPLAPMSAVKPRHVVVGNVNSNGSHNGSTHGCLRLSSRVPPPRHSSLPILALLLVCYLFSLFGPSLIIGASSSSLRLTSDQARRLSPAVKNILRQYGWSIPMPHHDVSIHTGLDSAPTTISTDPQPSILTPFLAPSLNHHTLSFASGLPSSGSLPGPNDDGNSGDSGDSNGNDDETTGIPTPKFESVLPDDPPGNATYLPNECQFVKKWPGPRCPGGFECISDPLMQQEQSAGTLTLSYRQSQCVFCAVTSFCTSAQKNECRRLEILEDQQSISTINDTLGVGTCHRCLAGKWCPGPAQGNVTGTTNPFGLAIINLCPPGYYCPTAPHKVKCPQGFFCPFGTKYPLACTITGTFCPAGSTMPDELCPGGYFCPNPQTRAVCPSGYFCKPGSIQPKRCPTLASCPEGSSAALLFWQGIILVLFSYTAMAALYYAVIYVQMRRRRKEAMEVARRVQGREVIQLLRNLRAFQHMERRRGLTPGQATENAIADIRVQQGLERGELTVERTAENQLAVISHVGGAKNVVAVINEDDKELIVEKHEPPPAPPSPPPPPAPPIEARPDSTSPLSSAVVQPVNDENDPTTTPLPRHTPPPLAHTNPEIVRTISDSTKENGQNRSRHNGAKYEAEVESDSDDDDEDERLTGFGQVPCPISLRFENLGLKLNDGTQVLQGVSGNFPAARLTAVMGPSGCGKSTFLNVLCGRAVYGEQVGDLYINNNRSSMSQIRSLLGFVPQDDVMHTDLTCYENLWYNAMLRLPRNVPHSQKKRIVDETIRMLGLEAVQHSVVGTQERRGISGGQRKRVNIGMELVAAPALVLMDEPTSGLDSTASLEVLSALRQLTDLGMSVIMVIHQPRFSVVELFHEMLLMGRGGQTVFLGNSQQALRYFAQIGFKVPPNENPADFFLDVISGEIRREGDPEFQPNQLFELWATKGQWVQKGFDRPTEEEEEEEEMEKHKTPKTPAGYLSPGLHSRTPHQPPPPLFVGSPSFYPASHAPWSSSTQGQVSTRPLPRAQTQNIPPYLDLTDAYALGGRASTAEPAYTDLYSPYEQAARHAADRDTHRRMLSLQLLDAYRAGVTDASQLPLPKHREMLQRLGREGINKLVDDYERRQQQVAAKAAKESARESAKRSARGSARGKPTSTTSQQAVARHAPHRSFSSRDLSWLFDRPSVTHHVTPGHHANRLASALGQGQSRRGGSAEPVTSVDRSPNAIPLQPTYAATATPGYHLAQPTPRDQFHRTSPDPQLHLPDAPPQRRHMRTMSNPVQLMGIAEEEDATTNTAAEQPQPPPHLIRDADGVPLLYRTRSDPTASIDAKSDAFTPPRTWKEQKSLDVNQADKSSECKHGDRGVTAPAASDSVVPAAPSSSASLLTTPAPADSGTDARSRHPHGRSGSYTYTPALEPIPWESESESKTDGGHSVSDAKSNSMRKSDKDWDELHSTRNAPVSKSGNGTHEFEKSRLNQPPSSPPMRAAVATAHHEKPPPSVDKSIEKNASKPMSPIKHVNTPDINLAVGMSTTKPAPRKLPFIHVQFLHIFQRQCLKLLRNINDIIFDMSLTTAVGLAIGLIFGGVWSLGGYSNISVMAVLSVGVLSCVSALKMFGNDRLIFWREARSGISITAYWLAVTLLHIPLNLLLSFLFVAPYYNLVLPDVSFFSTWLVFIAVYYSGSGGGMFLSIILAPVSALLAAVMIPLVISGFLNGVSPPLSGQNSVMHFFTELSFARYGVEALLTQQLEAQPGYAEELVDDIKAKIGFHRDDITFAIGMLLIIGTTFRLLTLAALYGVNREKRT